MKLPDCVKDWPEKNYYSRPPMNELPMTEARSAFSKEEDRIDAICRQN